MGALEAGTTLVVDRYAYSGAAFTAAKHATGLDLDWCKVIFVYTGPSLPSCARLPSACSTRDAHHSYLMQLKAKESCSFGVRQYIGP